MLVIATFLVSYMHHIRSCILFIILFRFQIPTMHKREEKICSNIYCHVNIRSHVTMLYTIDDNKFGRCFKQKSKAKPCMGHPNKISVGLHYCHSSLYIFNTNFFQQFCTRPQHETMTLYDVLYLNTFYNTFLQILRKFGIF